MGWVPDIIVAALRQSHNLGVFMRVGTSPPLHIWFGIGDVPIGFESIDPGGTVYMGGGQLIGVPSLEVLINGISDAVDFSISGVDATTGNAMLNSIPAVRGCLVHIGLTTLDDYNQPMSSPIPIWLGTASHLSETRPPVKEDEQVTLSLSLSVVTGENTRSRPSQALWSSAQHKSNHPGDLFCDNTGALSRGLQPVWPNY
jgi:hypothetical protein